MSVIKSNFLEESPKKITLDCNQRTNFLARQLFCTFTGVKTHNRNGGEPPMVTKKCFVQARWMESANRTGTGSCN